jgi:hypothetical protein
MEKVKVNQTVANWIEKHKAFSNEMKMLKITEYAREEISKTDNKYNGISEFFREQNIDIVTLAKAIQYGYEVEYEFKVGDIIWNERIGNLREVVEESSARIDAISVSYANLSKYDYKLICKAENREDLK